MPVCFYAFGAVFQKFDGIEVSPEEIKAMFGPSETGIIRENLKNINHEQAIELYYKRYSEKHQELVLESKDINDLLLFLKSQGYQLGIVTGKAYRSLFISLQLLNMDHLFDVIITGDDVIQPKPHPEGIHKALEQLQVKSSEAIFLGDSDADILAGKQAGVQTIGVHWLPNFQTPEFSVEPDQKFSSVNEFLQLIQTFVTK